MKNLAFLLILAVLAWGGQAFAQDAGVFQKWLSPESPQCVPMADIEKVSKIATLTPEQFQFVRALYVAIPPISKELPPGDHAIIAIAEGKAMLALVADDQTCARFLEPDFVAKMLDDVATGVSPKIGEPL